MNPYRLPEGFPALPGADGVTFSHGTLTIAGARAMVASVGIAHPCYGCGDVCPATDLTGYLCSGCGRFVCHLCWVDGGHGHHERHEFPNIMEGT